MRRSRDTLKQHGYIPDARRQADVDALVTFVASQTGQNYADSQASRFTTVAAYNLSSRADVAVTAAEGKQLFEQSGCYACHYIGNPNVQARHGRSPVRQGRRRRPGTVLGRRAPLAAVAGRALREPAGVRAGLDHADLPVLELAARGPVALRCVAAPGQSRRAPGLARPGHADARSRPSRAYRPTRSAT